MSWKSCMEISQCTAAKSRKAWNQGFCIILNTLVHFILNLLMYFLCPIHTYVNGTCILYVCIHFYVTSVLEKSIWFRNLWLGLLAKQCRWQSKKVRIQEVIASHINSNLVNSTPTGCWFYHQIVFCS